MTWESINSCDKGTGRHRGQVCSSDTDSCFRLRKSMLSCKPDCSRGCAPEVLEAAAQRQQLVDSERAGPVGPPLRSCRLGARARPVGACFSPRTDEKKLPEGSFSFFIFGERGIPIMTASRASTNFPEKSICDLPSLVPPKIIT